MVLTENEVSRILREAYQVHGSNNITPYIQMNRQIEDLALEFAAAFRREDPYNFKPLEFLDKCSPNPDRYPFSELWEDYAEI